MSDVTLAVMFSQREYVAKRVSYLNTYGQRSGVSPDCMLRKWCKATVQIRIEIMKCDGLCTAQPKLLSSIEIREEFGIRFDDDSTRSMMEKVCADVGPCDSQLLSVIGIADELLITFVSQ